MAEMGDDAFAAVGEPDGEGETAVAEEPEPTIEAEMPADMFAADWPDDADTEAEPEEEIVEPDALPSDWVEADSMLIDALDEEFPDWLDELGPPAADGEAESEPDMSVESSGSMPEWIVQMKPGSGFSGTGLTESSGLPEPAELYPDLPDNLAGTDLPDWLQDSGEAVGPPIPTLEESEDIPEWLSESMPADSGFGSQPPDDDGNEWTAVLQDLPPSTPIEQQVIKAEIPDWIMALKPAPLEDEAQEEAPVQEGGPLAGIRDVIAIEPVITEQQTNGVVPAFKISQEQLTQATLLKRLALADRGAVQSFGGTQTSSLGWVRLLLAGLLTAVILLGWMQPDLLRRAPAVVPVHLEEVHEAIEEAAGEPVLLAVEYTPALSGELDAQMKMVLAELAANGSPVVTVSQSAAGTAVAQNIAPDSPTLGLLPGQSVGLRQLSDCLSGRSTCEAVAGKTLTDSLQQILPDVALIIVLTGERDNLVDWLEQVALTSQIPLVAGVTQSLAPVAGPYLDTAQLAGMIGGLPETAVYQQQVLGQTPDTALMRQLSAQTLAQLLAAILLFIGGLIFGINHLLKRGGKS
jgi:hypothetical protein